MPYGLQVWGARGGPSHVPIGDSRKGRINGCPTVSYVCGSAGRHTPDKREIGSSTPLGPSVSEEIAPLAATAVSGASASARPLRRNVLSLLREP